MEIGTTTLLEFPNGEKAIVEQEQILAPEKRNKSERESHSAIRVGM